MPEAANIPVVTVCLLGEVPDMVWQVGLSLGIVATVMLLVVGVFSQPGEVKLSPQRAAAIATGHTDRRTVYEHRILKPVMLILLAMTHRLAIPRVKAWLRRQLIASGNPKYLTPEEYLAMCFFYGLVLGALLELMHILLTQQVSIGVVFLGVGVGVTVMVFQLYDQARRRLRLITKRIPYALDLIALAMGAGATFAEAVRTVAREDPDDPFNAELNAVLAEMDLGTTRRQALLDMSERVPIDMLRSIIASVIQAEELGTPLAEVLHSQATLLRLQRSARAENAAAVASVRILIPSLLILISVVLAVFAPAIIRAINRGGLF